MRHVTIKYLLLFAVAVASGCIRNDIPYPRIVAEITAFSVEGQVGETVIDNAKRSVTVNLAETVDIREVRVLSFDVSNDAKIDPEVTEYVDLTLPLKYTLTTYQDYVWTIIGQQDIERYLTVQNQVGEAVFHYDPVRGDYQVVVYVSKSQPITDVTITSMKLGPSNAVTTPDFTTVRDFTKAVTFTVKYHDITEVWTVVVMRADSDVITGDANAWARFATLKGSYAASSGVPTFEYKKAGAADWTKVPEGDVTVDGGNFSARITGLEPATQYVYRSLLGSSAGTQREFTTEAETQVPNMSFNDWYKDTKTWYPDLDLSEANYWWDSGNKGANSLAETNPTSPEEAFVVSGKAARLSSTSAAGVFAAASIFTGKFIRAIIKFPVSDSGAELEFGKPYTSRPQKLKGFYCYKPGTIDKASANYQYLKNTQDSCIIYAILGDWDVPCTINTSTGTFIDVKNDPHIIAYGEMRASRTMSAYEPFTADMVYRSTERKPKYLVLVASASKYGDYFTGSTSSVLYIDQFEFVFE